VSISDYPEYTRLRAKLVAVNESNWSERQSKWIKKRLGQVLIGTVQLVGGGLYFRPDYCNLLVLRDAEIDILGVE